MSEVGKFWNQVKKTSKAQNESPVLICQVTSKRPFRFILNGIERGEEFGDTVYINHLMLDDNINLDVPSMDEPQNITSMSPQPLISTAPTTSGDYTAEISGTQKTFLTDFYNFFKDFHNRYIIDIGDFIAVQKLGNNSYIVLQKVQKYEQ